MFRLSILGDWALPELEEFDSSDPDPTGFSSLMTLLSLSAALVISVLMMNLFIGVLSANYDCYEDLKVEMFFKERAKILSSYSTRQLWRYLPTFGWIRLPPRLKEVEQLNADKNSMRFLWVGAPQEISDLQTSQRIWTRDLVQKEVNRIIEELKKT